MMPSIKHFSYPTALSTLLLLICSFLPTNVTAFAASSSSTQQEKQAIVPRNFIQIQDPVDGPLSLTPSSFDEYVSAVIPSQQSRLPSSFIESWSTWILDLDGSISKIPDDEGFVSPASIDEIWQPVDLKPPQIRLALGLHVRQGVVRHVMPALDMGYISTSENINDSSKGGNNVVLCHRNRGLSSVPRAHTWVEFIPASIEGWDEYRLCLSGKEPPTKSSKDNKGENKWSTLCVSGPNLLGEAMKRAITSLAESPPDELGDGSHFVHVLLADTVDRSNNGENALTECPTVNSELRVTMIHDDDIENCEDEKLDASTLPTMGLLQVAISSTMPGSESENLPDAYKPLYFDSALRRPTYERFRKRREAREQKKQTGNN